ncbi:hypothetical protein ColTof4_01653 [Colletotrichum tofieldiae]|nr:hypothetical protein ColTof3_10066 [Colletotrichum tofieldiae]GKT69230.1 hypothetical protein ColTof4_01653 [Colletotrichum tofieldiae]
MGNWRRAPVAKQLLATVDWATEQRCRADDSATRRRLNRVDAVVDDEGKTWGFAVQYVKEIEIDWHTHQPVCQSEF